MSAINAILYPTDFSEYSRVAIPLAMDLAKHYSAELHCLHVVDTAQEYFMEAGYVVPLQVGPVDTEQLRKLAKDHMNEFANEHMSEMNGTVRKAVVLGKPFEQIIRYAREENVDLIVIGTHGHSALASMLLGSVAEKVIRKAPCAVLSMRHPEHKFQPP